MTETRITSPEDKRTPNGRGRAKTMLVMAGVAAALMGGMVGCSGTGNVNTVGSTTISSDATKQIAATYTYNGKQNTITYEDAIKYQGGATNEDGTYPVPTAEACLNLARQRIMQEHAKDKGVTVTDDDMAKYVKDQFGAESVDEMASSFGYEKDQLKEMLNDSIVQQKLFDQVTEGKSPTAPEYPAQPAEGKENEATKAYAEYITKLAGDAWDASANGGKGGWKDPEGMFAISCADYEITNDSANYNAAVAAYQAAYQDYSNKMTEFQQQWTDYMNQLYKDSPITLSSLVQ